MTEHLLELLKGERFKKQLMMMKRGKYSKLSKKKRQSRTKMGNNQKKNYRTSLIFCFIDNTRLIDGIAGFVEHTALNFEAVIRPVLT